METPESPDTAQEQPQTVVLPSLELEDYQPETATDIVADTFGAAIAWGIVGVGQCGGAMASAFYEIGYRKVLAINTSPNDLAKLPLPEQNKFVMASPSAGAGKDRIMGRSAAEDHADHIQETLVNLFGAATDRVLVIASAGGGTGSGGLPIIARAAQEYLKAVQRPERVGLLTVLPTRTASATERMNTTAFLDEIVDLTARSLVQPEALSPAIVVSNQRVLQMFPRVSTAQFFAVCNRNVASLWHIFNLLADQPSAWSTFDRKDYETVLDAWGFCLFGATGVKTTAEDIPETEIAEAVRRNLSGALLAEGFHLPTGSAAALIIVGNSDLLNRLPQSSVEYALDTTSRLLGRQGTVHCGVYEDDQPKLRVYTIVSGLELPPSLRAQYA